MVTITTSDGISMMLWLQLIDLSTEREISIMEEKGLHSHHSNVMLSVYEVNRTGDQISYA